MLNVLDEIRANPDRNFFISASAGTGKTFTLTEYYMQILINHEEKNEPEIVDRILAATFTKKAAGEMRERIVSKINEKIKNGVKNIDYWEKVKIYMVSSWITTIDSFCSKILRENNLEIGIDPDFQIMDNFTLSLEADTASSAAMKIMFELYDDGNVLNYPGMLGERRQRVDNIIYQLNLQSQLFKEAFIILVDQLGPESVEMEISKIIKSNKLEMMQADYIRVDIPGFPVILEAVHAVFRAVCLIAFEIFEWNTADRNIFDFKTALEKTYKTLEIPSVLNHYRKRFKYIIIDEYQDTNYLQKEMFDRLHTEQNHVFYVGDRKQSIYRFRGADVSVYMKTNDEFRSKDQESHILGTLNENWRSEKEIIDFANSFSANVLFSEESLAEFRPHDTSLFENSIFNDGDISYYPGKKQSPKIKILPSITKDGDLNNIKNVYLFHDEETEEKEKKMNSRDKRKLEIVTMARTITSLQGEKIVYEDGSEKILNYKDIAILFRENSDYEEHIKEVFSLYNIPYYISGSKSFYEQPEIQSLFSVIHVIQNPDNDYYLIKFMLSAVIGASLSDIDKINKFKKENKCFSLYNSLEKYIGADKNAEKARRAYEIIKKYTDARFFIKPSVIIKNIVEETFYRARLSVFDESTESAISNLRKLLVICDNLDGNYESLNELVKNLKAAINTEEEEASLEDESSDSVKIMTMHKSKGLEFDVVMLGGFLKKVESGEWDSDGKNKKYGKKAFSLSLPDEDGNRIFMIEKILPYEFRNSEHPDILRFTSNDFLDNTENRRVLYVAVTRPKMMLVNFIDNESSKENSNYGMMFKNYEYKKADTIYFDEIMDKAKIKQLKEKNQRLVPEKNLADLREKAKKKYFSPTTKIIDKFTRNEKIDENDDSLDLIDLDLLFGTEKTKAGTEIHKLMEDAVSMEDIKKYIAEGKLPAGLEDNEVISMMFDGDIIRTEEILRKSIVVEGKKYILTGIPDRYIVKRKNGINEITIFDYKYSSLDNPEQIEEYVYQLNFYMYLLKDRGLIGKGYIISLKNGKCYETGYDPDIEAKIIERIKLMNNN